MENRNLPGGNVSDIFLFNEVIGHLGLVELPIKGRQFTWSNTQTEPLLEQIDWFFTSVAWTLDHPNMLVLPLACTASDHVPCVVSIATAIPKAKVFRLENYWIDLLGFNACVAQVWNSSVTRSSAALTISSKFKALRYALKKWHLNLSTVKALISDCNKVILYFDGLEEIRPLTRTEFNFRRIVKLHLEDILHWAICILEAALYNTKH